MKPLQKQKKNTLTLKPEDKLILAGGLKIENISKDLIITFDLPERYETRPLISVQRSVEDSSEEVRATSEAFEPSPEVQKEADL